MSVFQKLVLASGSPRRIELLQQAGIEPDRIFPADVDETPLRAEHPRSLAKRLSRAKADKALESLSKEPDWDGGYILAADTVVAVGRRILPKAELVDEASNCLRLLSGRSHRVYSGVVLITPAGKVRQKLIETRVRFKRLSREELESYLASGQWRGKAGGYAIQGLAGSFVVKLVGSYTNVVGLPLYETVGLLAGDGYKVHFNWLSGTRTA
jgi:septum formation protein